MPGGPDEAAVRRVAMDVDRFQSDVDGFASLLTEDAVVVNAVGRRVEGREAMRAAMTEALRTPLAKVRTRLDIRGVRFLDDHVAIVAARKQVDTDGSAQARAGSEVQVSLLLVNRQGTWKVALIHNTLVHQADSPATEPAAE